MTWQPRWLRVTAEEAAQHPRTWRQLTAIRCRAIRPPREPALDAVGRRYEEARRRARVAFWRSTRVRDPIQLALTLALLDAHEAQDRAWEQGDRAALHAAAARASDLEQRLRDVVSPPRWTLLARAHPCGTRLRQTTTGHRAGHVWCPSCDPPEWAEPRFHFRPSRDCDCGVCDLCWLVSEVGEEIARELDEPADPPLPEPRLLPGAHPQRRYP